MLYHVTLLIAYSFHRVSSQLNLGSFNLKPGANGIWDLNFNQGGSILGFGGDRGFNAQLGQGVLGFGGTQGAVIGGERVGSDSQLGVSQGGINLGSYVNFGQGSKAGDLNSFIKGIGDFFKNMAPAPSQSTQSMSSIGEGESIASRPSSNSPMDGDVRMHRQNEEKDEEEGELVLMNEQPRG
uniref:Uncharacterized protein n=1 Tax=Pristionchus pacificus TaxID=54126 RepID=A0A8R1V5W5_PRIPA